jgi:hypothetical protein
MVVGCDINCINLNTPVDFKDTVLNASLPPVLALIPCLTPQTTGFIQVSIEAGILLRGNVPHDTPFKESSRITVLVHYLSRSKYAIAPIA